MKIKEIIHQFKARLQKAIEEQNQRNTFALEMRKKEIDKQRVDLQNRHEHIRRELVVSLEKGEIKQEFLDQQKEAMSTEFEAFEKFALNSITQQEELNQKNSETYKTVIRANIIDGIFNDLVKECVGNTNLVKKSFQGIPMHVQKYNLRWQLLARAFNQEFPDEQQTDPDRFYNFIDSEKSGVMLWQWKRWEQLKRCKRFIKKLAIEGDREAQDLLIQLNTENFNRLDSTGI